MFFVPNAFYCDLANLGHFWSLAIEEHFYLLWPAIVILTTSRQLKIVCACAILGAIIFRSVGEILEMPNDFFKLTPGRIDGLAMGSLLATWAAEGVLIKYRRLMMLAGSACAIILIYTFLRCRVLPAHHPLMHSFGFTVLGIGSSALIVLAVTSPVESIWQRLLSYSALRFFGKYSYGLYVIHGAVAPALVAAMPVEESIRMFNSVTVGTLFCLLAKIVICVFLAMGSWHLCEVHFLRLKRYFKKEALSTTAETMIGAPSR
jgi:peptidoglycan/LPS O-acetylase OafA/YrhL